MITSSALYRFYLKHVLGMRRFESPKVEMDALDFGSVLHETLEAFARAEAIRDTSDFREIEAMSSPSLMPFS